MITAKDFAYHEVAGFASGVSPESSTRGFQALISDIMENGTLVQKVEITEKLDNSSFLTKTLTITINERVDKS